MLGEDAHVCGENVKIDKKDYRNYPCYSINESAQYINVPSSTVRYWSVGNRNQKGVVKVAQREPQILLSFLNLVELHILSQIRRVHQVALPNVRSALNYVSRQFDMPRPLIDQSFETDGIDLFVTKFGETINASKDGQLGLTDILRSALKRVERDRSGIPIKLYPFTRGFADSPSIIVIDPHLSGGRPVLAAAGVATQIIAERYKAGDSIAHLARDYEREEKEIEEAIRAELAA